ncbi:unannotated protein [freshwater metagenome]|uniref:Unannotated protein n=1 Tax=freshwater metagenome TaxID=449393 RepID=A0A6J6ZV08_9ZZZZ
MEELLGKLLDGADVEIFIPEIEAGVIITANMPSKRNVVPVLVALRFVVGFSEVPPALGAISLFIGGTCAVGTIFFSYSTFAQT